MTIETNSFETIYFRPIQLRPRSWDHNHLRPRSFETCSSETTFTWVFVIWDILIWDHVQSRSHSFNTTFIWDHIHLRSHSFYATLKRSCFDLLCISFLWSTFHFFTGGLKFSKVTSFEVLQGCALPCPRWLTLGCKCTRASKHRRGQKALHTSGLEGSVWPLKCHFIRPTQRIQRIICSGSLPVSFIEASQ